MGKHGKDQKGRGYGFDDKSPKYGGMRANSKYEDCCPPEKATSEHRIDSISPILNQRGAGYAKLSKRVRKSLKRSVVSPTKKMSKKVLGKLRKLSKGLRRKKSKSRKQKGGAACPKRPESNHRDPSERKFGCRQGKWTPDCI